jgi:hypothetical protein
MKAFNSFYETHTSYFGKSLQSPNFKHVKSPEIDSKESILSAFVAWQAGTTTLFDVPTRQNT